jgi:3-oxoacyl-(acyl-carrier-protein) reductase
MVEIMLKEVELANGETIAYRERVGGTQKLLLIHGNMTSSKHWDLVYENLDSQFKIYAIDLRGFGNSSYNQPVEAIKDFADDVKLFVNELGLNDFSIAGWSTGGAVAMQFIADYPGYCNKLILLESVSTRGYPFCGKTSNNQEEHRVQSYSETKAELTKILPIQTAYDRGDTEFLTMVWNALIYTKNQPMLDLYAEYLQDMRTQRNLAEVWHSLNTFNISHYHNGLVEGNGIVDHIHVPVLVLRGDRDLVITAEMNNEILEDLGAKARFVELTDCGHSPLIDDLDQLLTVMGEFLTEEVEKLRLQDKVAIITGAANGLGLAAAETFAREGAKVALTDFNVEQGRLRANELREKGYEVTFFQVNVADRASVDKMVENVISIYGGVDILVNNAGITRDAMLKKLTAEDFQRVLDVNLTGVFHCTQAVLPSMLEKGWGRIISTSSVSGVYGNIGQTNYAAAKAGVVGMTKTWAKELGRKGINVNAVAPGFIETAMTEKVPENILDGIRKTIPLGRLGKPEDIANAYLYLASDESNYVNGTVLHVDGGIMM